MLFTSHTNELPAIFQEEGKRYYADTCESVKAAADRGEVFLQGWSHPCYPGTRLPLNFMEEMRTIGVWDAARNQSWGLDLHRNEGIEFTYVARGTTAFEVSGKTYTLKKGDLTITRPWQYHRVGNPNVMASHLFWLILDVNVRRPNQKWRWPEWTILSSDDLDQLTNLLQHNEQPVWQADVEVTRWCTKLTKLLDCPNPRESESKLKLYINELLMSVLEMLQRQEIPLNTHLSTSQRAVEMFLAALPEHLAYDWTLKSMSKQCGLSRSQFSNYCKQITNMSPVEYLTWCRIKAASTLLMECPDKSITEVAYSCGYNSSQYFATVFQNRTGRTPSDFRKVTTNDER